MKECTLCARCFDDSLSLCLDDGVELAATFPGPVTLAGKYRLVKRLGEGGMGTVYRALHLGLERAVAIKLLRADQGDGAERQAGFVAEARALARLDHPNVVEVADFGFDEAARRPYLVLELLAGTTFAERLRQGPLPEAEALAILAQVAAALDAAHERGILHRDLKAANVWLSPNGGGSPRVKLLDFGLASLLSDRTETVVFGEDPAPPPPTSAPEPTVLWGTPSAMAPELWRREPPSRASDLWAFGVLAFTVWAGRPPFAGTDPAALRAQIERGAPRPSALRPALEPLWDPPLLAPLATDPAARPARARDVVAALEAVYRRTARRRWRHRETPRRLLVAAALGALAALAVPGLETILRPLEHRLVDLRFATSAPRDPSRKLLLVLLDDDALESDPTPLPARGEELGAALDRALAAGAAGVALDLLPSAEWAASLAFSQLVAKRPEALVLAASSPAGRPVVGPEALAGWVVAVLGEDRTRRLFGSVDVEPDDDGLVRHGHLAFRDTEGGSRPAWAIRAARLLRQRTPAEAETRPFWIDPRVSVDALEHISERELAAVDPARLLGRLLVVGGDFAGMSDWHRIRQPGGTTRDVPGVVLQALMIETLLAGEPVRSAPGSWVLALTGLGAGLAAAAGLLGRHGLAVALGAAGLWLAASWAWFLGGGWLVPIAAPAAALGLAGLAALALGRWLAAHPQARRGGDTP